MHMLVCPLLHLHAQQLFWSALPKHTHVHVCVNTRAPPAVQPVLLALRTAVAGWQRAAPVSPAVPGSSSFLLTTTHPAPTSTLLSSTTRRSWTCLTVPVTLTHATANPTSKSTRMPVGASTLQGSRRASSARRTRWVRDRADMKEGWQLGAHRPGTCCEGTARRGGDLAWVGIEQPRGDVGRGWCARRAAAGCCPDSLAECFKVSFFRPPCCCS